MKRQGIVWTNTSLALVLAETASEGKRKKHPRRSGTPSPQRKILVQTIFWDLVPHQRNHGRSNQPQTTTEKESAPVVTSPTVASMRASWHPSSAKATDSPVKAPWSPPHVESSPKRTSWQPKSPPKPTPKSPVSEDKSDEPKLTSKDAQPEKHSVAEAARMWGSHDDIKYQHDGHHIEKPDISSFLAMRHQREGDSNRIDEYLPDTDPTGSPFGPCCRQRSHR